MGQRTNCLNCGAVLHYTKDDFGRSSKCAYCGTEYHIDNLGRVKEYTVKLLMGGKIISFYINTMAYKPNMLDCTPFVDMEGHLCRTMIDREPTISLELESYAIEEVK